MCKGGEFSLLMATAQLGVNWLLGVFNGHCTARYGLELLKRLLSTRPTNSHDPIAKSLCNEWLIYL